MHFFAENLLVLAAISFSFFARAAALPAPKTGELQTRQDVSFRLSSKLLFSLTNFSAIQLSNDDASVS